MKTRDMAVPAKPAAAAKMKPHSHPRAPTMTPVNMNVRNLPIYGVELKML